MAWFQTGTWQKLQGTLPLRCGRVLTRGSLGQRTVFVLGLVGIGFGVYRSLPWLALGIAGGTLCWFALRDFENRGDG